MYVHVTLGPPSKQKFKTYPNPNIKPNLTIAYIFLQYTKPPQCVDIIRRTS